LASINNNAEKPTEKRKDNAQSFHCELKGADIVNEIPGLTTTTRHRKPGNITIKTLQKTYQSLHIQDTTWHKIQLYNIWATSNFWLKDSCG
jgi:hypothetical protein